MGKQTRDLPFPVDVSNLKGRNYLPG